MSSKENIQLRDARDRLCELLQLGEPFPLRDLPVPVEGLTVPFKQAARIPLELSQLGVLYQLHDPREQLVTWPADGTPVQAQGTGEIINLEAAPIEDDVTYKILATKQGSQQHAYLHIPAIVKVGLDSSLIAWISNHPVLDSMADELLPTDPRLCDYGDTLEVEIALSQEGVDYKLVHFVSDGASKPTELVLSAEVRGTDKNIVLYSESLMEDSTIRIRATKTFEPEEGRETQTDLLDIELPLKVKANPALNVSVLSPIIDYSAQTTVRIAATQNSAEYRVYAHRIRDPEIVHEPASDTEVLRVLLPNEPQVQVRRPLLPEPWALMATYEPISELRAGNGGELIINIDAVTEDYLFIVEARKSHQLTETKRLPSSAWLNEPVLQLVRPNPTPDLSFTVVMQDAATDGNLIVEGGQAGVFYFFSIATDVELPQPAYFYQRDDVDSSLNKGIGQIEVGIDLVVAADPPVAVIETSPDLSRLAPQPPLLNSGPLAIGTTMSGRAVKAQTRIDATLTHSGKIKTLPEIKLAQVGIDAGTTATIQIISSQVGDVYELQLDGDIVKPALQGDGSSLEIETAAINADSQFEVRVNRPDDTGIEVQQMVPRTVLLKPDAGLTVSAVASEVDSGGATEILLAASQTDAIYQLLIGGTVTGDPLPGTGENLTLPTGPLTADTTFVVRASRLLDATVTVELTQQATVTIRTA